MVEPDDILPNNTTFVLGHLAFHLDAGKIVATPGDASHLDDYIVAMLDQEARAYIHAWNDALDAAVQPRLGYWPLHLSTRLYAVARQAQRRFYDLAGCHRRSIGSIDHRHRADLGRDHRALIRSFTE